jgi:hypothetical protein
MNNSKNILNKRVKFNLEEKYIKTYNVDRRLSMGYYRGLIKKCSDSHNKIFNILKKYTNILFLPLNKEDPIHIKNPNKYWDIDDSPCRLLNIWENSIFFKHHLNIINNKINLHRNKNKEQNIKINIKHKKELFIINVKISNQKLL